MQSLVFYPFATLAVVSALGVILLRNPTRALLSLIVTMFSLAVLFLQLKAYFVAMVHLIVYAGAVLVLFLFVIMLLGMKTKESSLLEQTRKGFLGLAFFVPTAFLGLLIYLAASLEKKPLNPAEGGAENLGTFLFTRHLLPFELVSFLLLIGVFAAVALASAKPKEKA